MLEWDDDNIRPVHAGGRAFQRPEGLLVRIDTIKQGDATAQKIKFHLGADLTHQLKWLKGDRVTLKFNRLEKLVLICRVTGSSRGWGLRTNTKSDRLDEISLFTDMSMRSMPEDLRQVLADFYKTPGMYVDAKISSEGVYFRMISSEDWNEELTKADAVANAVEVSNPPI